MNPGVQEVVDQLTSNLRGQQIYLTPFERKQAAVFADISAECHNAGHLVIGVKRDETSHLNLSSDFSVQSGDGIISIGKERLAPLR
jgi:hypothetical protein